MRTAYPFYLAVDGIAAPLFLLNGVVVMAGTLVSLKLENRNKDFFILLFVLASGVFGVFGSQDLFFFFFWYEVAVLPMYMLIGIWGSSTDFGTFLRTKEYGALKLTLMLVGGSVLIFLGIFAIFVESGLNTFDLPTLASVEYDEDFQKIVFPLFLIGFGTLAGMWPLHTWSPDGHVAAPTAVSMLHAGVLMKLGAFGILRVGIYLLPVGAAFWMPALLVVGIIGALYGAISAFGQRDLKYMIGYSSVSHMGYVLIGLATLNEIGVNGAVLQMFSHGMMTAHVLRRCRRPLRRGPHPRHDPLRRTGQIAATHRRVHGYRGPHLSWLTRTVGLRGRVHHLRRPLPGL